MLSLRSVYMESDTNLTDSYIAGLFRRSGEKDARPDSTSELLQKILIGGLSL